MRSLRTGSTNDRLQVEHDLKKLRASNPNLAHEIEDVCHMLIHEGAPSGAMRVALACARIDELDPDALYRLVDPERTSRDLGTAFQSRIRPIKNSRVLIGLVGLLFPVFAIAYTFAMYQRDIELHPLDNRVSFLILWQDGFRGSSILTLSHVALIIAVLGMVFMVSTIAVQRTEQRVARNVQSMMRSVDDVLQRLMQVSGTRLNSLGTTPADWALAVQQTLSKSVEDSRNFVASSQAELQRQIDELRHAPRSTHTSQLRTSSGNNRVFVSHSHEDNERCQPLLEALSTWHVDYWFDRERVDPGDVLAHRIQQAIAERDIFIRVCTSAVEARPFWVDLETEAFRSLQADDVNGGLSGKRILIPLILDRDYHLRPFERAVLYVDAVGKPVSEWLSELRRVLGSLGSDSTHKQ